MSDARSTTNVVYVVETWRPGNLATRQAIAVFGSKVDARKLLEEMSFDEPHWAATTWTQSSSSAGFPGKHAQIVAVPYEPAREQIRT